MLSAGLLPDLCRSHASTLHYPLFSGRSTSEEPSRPQSFSLHSTGLASPTVPQTVSRMRFIPLPSAWLRLARYPPATTIAPPPPEPTWDEIRRPAPRPITKTHDESRLYYQTEVAKEDPRKLEAFRAYEELKGEGKVEKAERYYLRDEL